MGEYKVMIYNGQLDVIIAFPQTENFLNALDWTGKYVYAMTPRTIWKVQGEVAGYVRKAKNLTQVMVRNAGHILPHSTKMGVRYDPTVYSGQRFLNSTLLFCLTLYT